MSKDETTLDELIKPAEVLEKENIRLRETIRRFVNDSQRKYKIGVGDKKWIRMALIGDTHGASRYARWDALGQFIGLCDAEKIDEVYHTGDLLDGHRVYPGQEFEVYAHGYEEQKADFIEKFPRRKHGRLHFITGNHDASFKKYAGANVGLDLSRERPDLDFLGEDYAEIVIENKSGWKYKLSLVHPDGGTAYAISYKIQKYIESLSGGQKPNAIGMGHFHKAEWLPVYRNVHGFQSGTFQSQTPFMKRRGLAAQVGGWIIEVMPEGLLTSRIRAEFISFYEPKG